MQAGSFKRSFSARIRVIFGYGFIDRVKMGRFFLSYMTKKDNLPENSYSDSDLNKNIV
ncbi:MAG: hypothetical protein ACOCJN_04710 [Spirochaetaceae bacterium JB067]